MAILKVPCPSLVASDVSINMGPVKSCESYMNIVRH